MMVKRLIGAFLVATVGVFFSVSASATTYNFAVPIGFGSYALGSHVVSAGSFTDVINFSLNKSGVLSASVTPNTFVTGHKTVFGIAGLNAGFYTAGGTLLGSGTGFTAAGTQNAGSYYLKITGVGIGAFGGQYSANLGFNKPSISPTPEPATWAMMIGGLALMSCVVRRKQVEASLMPISV